MKSLWLQVSSNSSKKVSNLVVLLEHIEKGLPRHLKDKSSESIGDNFSNSIRETPYSTAPITDHFKLLRNEYSKIRSPLVADLTNFNDEQVIYRFNIPVGARPTIFWGQNIKQVLGKNSIKNNIIKTDKGVVSGKGPGENSVQLKKNAIYVVTPSFNSAKFIDSTISSVASQEGLFDIFYHVQDGGSSDGTVEKLLKWQRLFSDPDNNIVRCQSLTFTFQSEKDEGLYEAINKGFGTLAPPDDGICTWINSDDVFNSGAFSSACNIFTSNPEESWLIGATCGCNEFLEQLSFEALQFPQEVIRRGLCDGINWRFIQQEGSFWRGHLWKTVDGLNSSLKFCGDWDLWRRFAEVVEPVQVEWPLGKFRFNQGQLSSSIEDYYEEMNEIVPEIVRQEQLEALRNVALSPTKIVKLPGRRGAIPTYECIPLQSKYLGRFNWRVDAGRTNSVFNQLLENAKQQSPKVIAQKPPKGSSQKPLSVLTLNTIARGGAGTGTLRRIEALRNIGVDAKLISLISTLPKEYIGRIEPTLDGLNTGDQYKVWQYIISNVRNQVMNLPGFRGQELFTLAESVIDLRQLKPLIDEVDIVHLHWVVGMLDYENMPDVLAGKPIVWTTGDMNSFTGGCHYSEGCEGFMRECADCPMLSSTSSVPHEAWKTKKKAYESMDITVVCPSEYMANIVRKSSLLGDRPIQVISNAYPIDRFHPVDQSKARQQFNLPLKKKLLLFGAESLSNLRKGGDLFRQVVDLLSDSPLGDEIEAVLFGTGSLNLPMKVNYLGSLSEGQMAAAYSAADVFVSLSREDVGPMTVVESLLCGTPVVGFPIGVLPEVVTQKSNGYLAKPFSVDEIINGIKWALDATNSDSSIIEKCQTPAIKHADPKIAAEKHRKLYNEKLARI